MGRQLPAAYAGRRRRSQSAAAAGIRKKILVPAARIRELGLRPNEARAREFPPMAEDREFLPLVRAGIARRRLGSYHTLIAIGSDEGYPDITAWGVGGIAWYELKGSKGKIDAAQLATIQGIRAAGGDARFLWPEDYYLGLVDELLDNLVGIPPGERERHVLKPGHRFCGCPMDTDHTCPTWGGGC